MRARPSERGAQAAAGLVVEGLGVTLGGRRALDGVSFSVAPGGWIGVIGPNGAGKTTLLRAIAGLAAHDGAATVGGRAVRAAPGRVRARLVALAPQTPVLPAGMRVSDYVLLGRTAHLGPYGAEGAADLAVVHDVLVRLDLIGFAGRRIETLSGGERQRAVIARCLCQEAPVLLLDEPTSALDLGRQHEVMQLVDELRRDRRLTVVSTLHDLALAGAYPDRLLLLAHGRAAALGTRDEVLAPELIEAHYGIAVRAVRDPDSGAVTLHPAPGGPGRAARRR